MTKRFDEILKKSPFNQHTDDYLIKLEDMNEIAKIVEELEQENKQLKKINNENYWAGNEIKFENLRYKQALDFYADDESWSIYDHHGRTRVGIDGGRIARKALDGDLDE